jgi:hypothetical protein
MRRAAAETLLSASASSRPLPSRHFGVDICVYKSPSAEDARPTIAGFEWDAGNREKCAKHGVSAAEIEEVFAKAVAVFPDPAHSTSEERFKAIGQSNAGRSLLIVFTLRPQRGATFLRPISARPMHRKEIEHLEKELAKTGQ